MQINYDCVGNLKLTIMSASMNAVKKYSFSEELDLIQDLYKSSELHKFTHWTFGSAFPNAFFDTGTTKTMKTFRYSDRNRNRGILNTQSCRRLRR